METIRVGIIGLGYVGLPLAVEFSKKYETFGFDTSASRVNELFQCHDKTQEVSQQELSNATKLSFTQQIEELRHCNFFIITVPTPIDNCKNPDLNSLISATKSVAKILKKNDIVIYESTVYPGATEEECVPILENVSKLKFNKDFFCGYSPERINPGDKKHRLRDIVKITSGSTVLAAEKIDRLYSSIISAGTYRVSAIKVAEAAKVIENTQRDLNIGLINELSQIFKTLGLDTEEVLNAAATKWNFMPFRPGLVGGHCIGVDPYYLTYKAKSIGHKADIILAARQVNDNMANYAAELLLQNMRSKNIDTEKSQVLVMGLTFKENCPDIRNTKVIDLIERLKTSVLKVDCFDPWVESEVAKVELGLNIFNSLPSHKYDAVLLAVAHDEFKNMGADKIRGICKNISIFFDMKSVFPLSQSDIRL